MLADECQQAGHQALLLPLAARLAPSRLLPARPHRPLRRPRPRRATSNRYLDYMDAQLTELLTGYGEIGGIWFDGWWDKPEADWRLAQTYEPHPRLQPAALVGQQPPPEAVPGRRLPDVREGPARAQHRGLQRRSRRSARCPSRCATPSTTPGATTRPTAATRARSSSSHLLVKAAGYDANFLLNVGPQPDGTIQPEFVARLSEVGAVAAARTASRSTARAAGRCRPATGA